MMGFCWAGAAAIVVPAPAYYRADASDTTSTGSNLSTLQNASSWSIVMGVWPCRTRDTVAGATPALRASSSCDIDDSCMCANKIRATARFRMPGTSARYRRHAASTSRISCVPYMEGERSIFPTASAVGIPNELECV